MAEGERGGHLRYAAWSVFGEGPTAVVEGPFADTKRGGFAAADIRFTKKGADLYAIALAWPGGDTVHIKTLASASRHLPGEIASVALLGSNTDVRWRRDAEGLHIDLPRGRPPSMPPAVTFKIALR